MLETLRFALGLQRPAGSQQVKQLGDHIAALHPSAYWTAEGALLIQVGEGSRTLFCAHLDTVHRKAGEQAPVWTKSRVSCPGNILGADDGAGCAILAGLILAETPGTYLFTPDEECGGSTMRELARKYADFFGEFDRAIAFDRKGKTSICGAQMVGNLASRAFVRELASELGMGHVWDTGTYTDNSEFQGIIPEIVNVSVGYEKAHTPEEYLDLEYLDRLMAACLTVEWEHLPVEGPEPEPKTEWGSLFGNWNDAPSEDWGDAAEDLCMLLGYVPGVPEYDLVFDSFQRFAERTMHAYR